jgi:hypothetical protein
LDSWVRVLRLDGKYTQISLGSGFAGVWISMRKQGKFFYQKFVDEDRLRMIDDILIQRKYWVYSFSISLFSLCSATFPTFVGYNFENAFALCMFLWELFMFFLLLLFSVKFLQLERRHSVFRKKRYPFLFSAFYVILSLTFALVACFTTRFVSYPDSSFSVFINPVFYLFVFLPLYFSYALFCYYAFMKCFGKYTKSGQGKDRQAVE